MHRHYFDLEDLKIKTLNRHYALALSLKLVQKKQQQNTNKWGKYLTKKCLKS
jgi:hypothetical protein